MDEKQIAIRLGKRSYDISVGRELESKVETIKLEYVSRGRKAAVVLDQGILEANPNFFSRFFSSLPVLKIPSGEKSKSVMQLEKVWNFLAENKIDRSSALFAVGGGVVGDLAGFAAASYLRGISFYQIPTTLLSMVDSSVGGKTGINLSSGKNLVGAFYQPKAVFIDLNALGTLPEREFSSGMAEVIKYGLLGDRSLFFNLLESFQIMNSENSRLAELVLRCCSIKAEIVETDEKEKSLGEGGRALLNLGHTFAHAIEARAGYGSYLHGEAVSIGLICAFRISRHLGLCEDEDESNLSTLLKRYKLPRQLKEPLPVEDLMEAMQSDKKVMNGKVRFVLLKKIGSSFLTEDVEGHQVKKVLQSVGAS